MQTVSMNLAIHNAQESFKDLGSLERLTPKTSNSWLARLIFWPLEFFFLPKLKRISILSAEMCTRFKIFVLDVRQNTKYELIDPELELNKNLESLKLILRASLEDIHKVIANLEKFGDLASKSCREIKVFAALGYELYEEVELLQQAVAEHDATFSVKSGEVALLFKRVNVDRMQRALAENSISVPRGLSREEKRRLMLLQASPS